MSELKNKKAYVPIQAYSIVDFTDMLNAWSEAGYRLAGTYTIRDNNGSPVYEAVMVKDEYILAKLDSDKKGAW